MNTLNRAVAAIFMLSLAINSNSFAENEDNDSTIHKLKKIVVTATKRSRSVSDIPVSATIFDKEDILRSEAKSVDDLLQYASGVQVKRAVGMGEGVPSDIIMRGIPGALAATRTLILVDGIPTNVSGTPFLILNEIPLESIQRIEIIRGPFSSIYGANAFGGVINIITDIGDGRPSLRLTGETSYPFTSLHNYGVEGRETGVSFWRENAEIAYWNGSAAFGTGNEKIDLLVVGGFRTIGNYFLKDSALVRSGTNKWNKDISNHDYTDVRLLARSGWRFAENASNNLHVRYFDSELGFGKTGTEPNADVIIKGRKILIGDYIEYSPRANLHLKVGGFFRSVIGDYLDKADSVSIANGKMTSYGKVPTMWDADSRDIQIEGSIVFAPSKTHTIITGADYLRNTIGFGALKYQSTGDIRQGEADIDRSFQNTGVYIQDDINLSIFNIIPAIRFDHHSQFGTMFSPKLGVSSRLADRFTLRTSAGTAFRAPSTTELYGNIIMGSVKILGNQNLLPERVIAGDAGIDVDLLPGLTLISSVFYNKMNNLIALKIDSRVFNQEITHGNVNRAYSWGIENEIKADLWKPFTGAVNYTFTQSSNQSNDKPLDYIPAHKINAEVTYTQVIGDGRVHVSIKEGFVGRRSYLDWASSNIESILINGVPARQLSNNYVELKPYWRTDVLMMYTFKNNHTVSFSMQNCFDAVIEESNGTYSPGRFASLKYSAPLTF